MFTTTSRWVFTYSVIVLGLLWMLAPDIARVWLGPGQERIASLIRLWVIAYAVNLAYSPGVAIARGMGMPRYEIMSYAAALVTSVGLGILWVPTQGTAGSITAIAVSYGVGFLVFVVTFHRGLPMFAFWSWLRRDLAPRAIAGAVSVAVVTLILSLPAVASRLPELGWVHGALTASVFMATFAILFLPLGDTQRLMTAFRQIAGGVVPGRGGVTS